MNSLNVSEMLRYHSEEHRKKAYKHVPHHYQTLDKRTFTDSFLKRLHNESFKWTTNTQNPTMGHIFSRNANSVSS